MSYRLRLPATSANLGPGFDALGLAMGLWLEVEAEVAEEFRIEASGRDAGLVGTLEGNLMVETYCGVTGAVAGARPPLELKVRNEIPLGMGCGSSAAALLAGVMLANRFGGLRMTAEEVVAEACRREGHPDNVAACFYGGMTASAMEGGQVAGGRVATATFGAKLPWRLLIALPEASLATAEARAMLPAQYSRADVVVNIQATAQLVSAFAQGRPELLTAGTKDRVHQPYRMGVCPLLGALLPLSGTGGIYSVTLSGAGPSVLLIVDDGVQVEELVDRIRDTVGDMKVEVLEMGIAGGVRELL